jgi:peptidoglycan/LPS O-acetylase OafA/YrhL
VHFFSSIQNPQGPIGITGDFSVDHLWFILFLFIFSVVALGLILLGRRWAGLRLCPGNAGFPVLVLLFIPVWLLNYAGFNVTGYSMLSYFAIFLTGYCLLSQEPVLARLEKYWAVLLAAWICLTIGVMWIYGIFLGHSEVFWGSSALFVVTGWTGLLALLGAGRHLADRTSPLTTYLGAASYPVYIIHQAVLVAVAYYVLMFAIPPALQFLAIVIFSVLLTFACYEILRRIPGVRVLFEIAGPGKRRA